MCFFSSLSAVPNFTFNILHTLSIAQPLVKSLSETVIVPLQTFLVGFLNSPNHISTLSFRQRSAIEKLVKMGFSLQAGFPAQLPSYPVKSLGRAAPRPSFFLGRSGLDESEMLMPLPGDD